MVCRLFVGGIILQSYCERLDAIEANSTSVFGKSRQKSTGARFFCDNFEKPWKMNSLELIIFLEKWKCYIYSLYL